MDNAQYSKFGLLILLVHDIWYSLHSHGCAREVGRVSIGGIIAGVAARGRLKSTQGLNPPKAHIIGGRGCPLPLPAYTKVHTLKMNWLHEDAHQSSNFENTHQKVIFQSNQNAMFYKMPFSILSNPKWVQTWKKDTPINPPMTHIVRHPSSSQSSVRLQTFVFCLLQRLLQLTPVSLILHIIIVFLTIYF